MKYDFNKAKDTILSVRIDETTAGKIKDIARINKTTAQEVCRVFLREALNDYNSAKNKEIK